ncbi:hypothetical protein TNCV_1828861 [Trichonephila clavipes]|nr:hypothetical protein TNCV_1828861 [Trichonephila clavipes]
MSSKTRNVISSFCEWKILKACLRMEEKEDEAHGKEEEYKESKFKRLEILSEYDYESEDYCVRPTERKTVTRPFRINLTVSKLD